MTPRTRSTLLWVCSVCAALSVAAWGASSRFRLHRDRGLPVWGDRREMGESIRLDLSDATLSVNPENRIFGQWVDVEETVTVWEVGGGSIGFTVFDGSARSVPPERPRRCDAGATPMRWRFEQRRVMGPGTFFVVPLWPVVALAVLTAGAAWVPAIRRARRVRLERCVKCGYDRRGIAADAKCPECGCAPVTSSSASPH